MSNTNILEQAIHREKTEELVDTLLEYIDEKIDRAIFLHENENRHELSSGYDISPSSLLEKLGVELKEKFMKILL